MINAVIPVWKPVDWTSFDVVKKIRYQIKPAKVGHAGTLDPFAEGVLMLCTGSKTKSVEYFMDQRKIYIANILLGAETDTLDLTGKMLSSNAPVPSLSENKILKVLSKFKGSIMQEPPMYSALKFKGQPLYKMARKGIVVKRKKRMVSIYNIALLGYAKYSISIKVECGRGTYIRSLARDIAKELGTVGYLESLKRISIGNYNEEACIKVKDFPNWLLSNI